MLLRRLLASLLALLLPACAPIDAPPANAADLYHGPAIWKVADKDTTIYLFGTVHALPDDAHWFSGPVARAWRQSNELVTEIPMNDATGDAKAITAHALLPAGQSLRDLMTPDDRKQFEETLVSLGLPIEAMDKFQPWYAALTLSLLPATQAGYDPKAGAETELAAKADGKSRAALETVDQQIALFAGLPIKAQLAFLDDTVEFGVDRGGHARRDGCRLDEGRSRRAGDAAQRRSRRPGAVQAPADRPQRALGTVDRRPPETAGDGVRRGRRGAPGG